MRAHQAFVSGTALLLLCGVTAAPGGIAAQGPDGRWPLQPHSGVGRLVAPFLEGWFENEDGTFSYSFGYLNLNDDRVEIPLGELNLVEPAQLAGMQPTTFDPGRHRGVFAVTVPASMAGDDVWWTITNPDGEVTKVPGRNTWGAYKLDWLPRPHGSRHPLVSFDGSTEGRGPPGVVAERTLSAAVGTPLTVAVEVRDPSERDRADPRLRESIPVRVVWYKHQGPVGARVEFTRHESTPVPAGRRGGDDDAVDGASAAGAIVELPSGEGTARVVVTFSEPGEYVLRARADNWSAPDSSSGNQCCWTNGYVRVTVR
jgi:hypothetical protein